MSILRPPEVIDRDINICIYDLFLPQWGKRSWNFWDWNAIKRVWKLTRRLRTHNRYFKTSGELTETIREQFKIGSGSKARSANLMGLKKR